MQPHDQPDSFWWYATVILAAAVVVVGFLVLSAGVEPIRWGY